MQLDIFGEEYQPKKAATPKKVDKPDQKKTVVEQAIEDEKRQWTSDHPDSLTEESTPKAWLHVVSMLQLEVKTLKQRLSEIKDLREYVAKNERRVGEVISSFEKFKEEINSQVLSHEEVIEKLHTLIEQLEQENDEDE